MTISFLEHVRRIVERICKPYGVRVFDEREKSLVWLIDESLSEGLASALVVSVPTLKRVQGEPVHSGLHELSCTVAVRCNAAMSRVAAYSLAEKLYTALHGSVWREPTNEQDEAALQPNVAADSLTSSSSPDSSDTLHTISVSTTVSL